ncbi:hypothetical protein L3V79_09520 [Thiotrichales bacterium 19S9-12]|nr:hypothetical protein [Thiotrichales bacterium 19S9-11]MCF6812595.1 hypothetical protein [Thiotrichales bacterium 19S9-12]
MKVSKDVVMFTLKLSTLIFTSTILPFVFLIWLSGYQIVLGQVSLWLIFLCVFIWLFWPLRAVKNLSKIVLKYYFKQLFSDTKVIVLFIFNLIMGNLHLIWSLIKGLIRISKHH